MTKLPHGVRTNQGVVSKGSRAHGPRKPASDRDREIARNLRRVAMWLDELAEALLPESRGRKN